MITPKEIETKQFTSTKGGGYKGDEVDQFLDEILVDYTRLLEERNALKNKVNLLTEKLNTMTAAPAPAPVVAPEPVAAPAPVVINQVPSEELEAARKKAARLVADAEDYAKKLIETAQYESNRQNAVAQKLAAEIEAFRNSLLDTYSAHIKMVEAIPGLQFEDVKIGSETLDILNQSFNDAAPAPAPAADAPAAAAPAEDFEIPTRAAAPAADAVAFDESLLEDITKKRPEKPAAGGLEGLFDGDDAKGKKKDSKKKKKKLFFRDEDDDDDDFFDDDDE